MAVIRGTKGLKRRRQQVVIKKAGHPGNIRKIRCAACSLGYAVESNTNKGVYQCGRCGHAFVMQAM